MSEPAARKPRAAPTILALVAVFAVPMIAAWWLAVVRPPSTGQGLLNHGTLIQPPVDVGAHPELQALDEIKLEPSEWAIVYVGPGPCAATCEAALNKLATIRTVLGQGATRVRIAALIDDTTDSALRVVMIADRTARTFLSATLAERGAGMQDRGIVFLDWRRQMMIVFDVDVPPGDIKKDIKRLLRASKIN